MRFRLLYVAIFHVIARFCQDADDVDCLSDSRLIHSTASLPDTYSSSKSFSCTRNYFLMSSMLAWQDHHVSRTNMMVTVGWQARWHYGGGSIRCSCFCLRIHFDWNAVPSVFRNLWNPWKQVSQAHNCWCERIAGSATPCPMLLDWCWSVSFCLHTIYWHWHRSLAGCHGLLYMLHNWRIFFCWTLTRVSGRDTGQCNAGVLHVMYGNNVLLMLPAYCDINAIRFWCVPVGPTTFWQSTRYMWPYP